MAQLLVPPVTEPLAPPVVELVAPRAAELVGPVAPHVASLLVVPRARRVGPQVILPLELLVGRQQARLLAVPAAGEPDWDPPPATARTGR